MKTITMSAIVREGTEEEICQQIRRLVGEKNGTVEEIQVKDAPVQESPKQDSPKEPPKGSGATLRGVA